MQAEQAQSGTVLEAGKRGSGEVAVVGAFNRDHQMLRITGSIATPLVGAMTVLVTACGLQVNTGGTSRPRMLRLAGALVRRVPPLRRLAASLHGAFLAQRELAAERRSRCREKA